MRVTIRIFLVLAGLSVAACTPALQVAQVPSLEPTRAELDAEQADRFWWQLRIKLVWLQGQEPDFSQHLLLAEQLLLPVITTHQHQLPLWRFHRRAGRDRTGHQFSLLFFADETTATRINETVSANPLTLWLVEQKMIEKTRFQKRSKEELGQLENTSDPNWPMAIQRSWPYFIMGASQTWLMLVQELSSEEPLTDTVDYPALLAHYRVVDAKLNAQWRDYAQHAYLHHLSAIFGYQPVKIRSSELKTF